MRAFSRSMLAMLVAAAAAGAAFAHGVIDVVADYVVAHASYDDVGRHGSREIVLGVAFVAAAIAGLRGFLLCCDAVAGRGVRVAKPPSWQNAIPFSVAAVALATLGVPAMEWADTVVAGRALGDLSDAFGGSVAMGLATTVCCAALVAIVVFALARWLLSCRDQIIATIAAVLRRSPALPVASARVRNLTAIPLRRRSVASLRRGKRAPPRCVDESPHVAVTTRRGFSCFTCSSRRAA